VDLRLLRYMLAVPAIPWARDKYLLRRAMRGILPDPVLMRPKSPLSGDPQWEAALSCGLAPLLPACGLEKYVDPIRTPRQVNQDMMTTGCATCRAKRMIWNIQSHRLNSVRKVSSDSTASRY
jgi:hypothetical protein